MALTDDDRIILHNLFMHGPAALVEAGFDTPETMQEFAKRPDVLAEWHLLSQEFDIQEAIFDRTKFLLKRQLSRIGSAATSLLAHGLAGPTYMRSAKGHVLRDAKGKPIVEEPEPTKNQLRSAETILNRLGLDAEMNVDKSHKPDIGDVHKVEKQKVEIRQDPTLATHEERVLSRERMRNAIERFAEKLPQMRDQALKELEPKSKPKRKNKKKKFPKKKAKKKVKKKAKKKAKARV